ncbi:uv radiation resistance-associated protein [Plasmopara halstedii]|uniref:Uv radiation resistance-associated protein n=1 Tax=Plasmopara halstedii TaxID=4781 RepID=A0A0P1AXT9_PLAHL|nr:uv radiation resistance-associated protein [Plasmopara halstedii]CEG46492.1 uv radiation resistance-associated protein [Plasmopara halstedii]|eukprot:XP_024582861.1 uv radiation resistance-associated protein [Plasmopara halstedii]
MITPSNIAGSIGGAINMTACSVAPSWNTQPPIARLATVTLKQLSGFSMRNLSIHGTSGDALLSVYFKLVIDGRIVYKSEVACNTLNPVWVPFHDGLLGDEMVMSGGTRFDIIVVHVHDRMTTKRMRRKSCSMSGRLSFGDDQPINNSRSFADAKYSSDDVGDATLINKLTDKAPQTDVNNPHEVVSAVFEEDLISMSFDVLELEPLPVALSDLMNLPLNTSLFEFTGCTFVHREVLEFLVEKGVIAPKHSRRKGSAIPLKDYSLHEGVDALERILTTRQKITDLNKSNAVLKERIRNQLLHSRQRILREQQRIALEERVRRARVQVAEKQHTLARIKAVMQDERRTFETDIHVPKALLSTMQMSLRYKDERQNILERRCEVLRAAHKIRSRQAMLVKQLGTVYPIEYVGAGEYSIRGIRIANSDLSGGGRNDEEMISTALGYIAHLVFMLSKYLHVNLRYRVVPYSSRSFLKDEINDPSGEYPLYKRGVEKERHEKAIRFLRKNVEQLLFARSLDPTLEAPILARLKELTDAESAWLAIDRNLSNNVNSSNSTDTGTIVAR